jgi:DNA gyrase/topoisomerase IV subunit B
LLANVCFASLSLTRHLVEKLNKKSKNNNVKPFMVKNHLWVFINAQIENPAFDSQVSPRECHSEHRAASTCCCYAATFSRIPCSNICLPPPVNSKHYILY